MGYQQGTRGDEQETCSQVEGQTAPASPQGGSAGHPRFRLSRHMGDV